MLTAEHLCPCHPEVEALLSIPLSSLALEVLSLNQYSDMLIYLPWASRKQASVALSSCEAEIMAGSEAAKEAVYLRGFLSELGFSDAQATKLYMDNRGAIDLAYNPDP